MPRLHFNSGRISTFFLIAGLMTLVAGRAGSHAQQPPVPAPQAPGQAPGGGRGGPRNIQVLKDVPQDQILLTMQYIAASLGVQCNYCHVQGQNDSDDKETKKIAREMMKMVDKVNATFFDGKPRVSCASCHNGRAKPVRTPPLAIEMTAEQAAAAAARGRGGRGGPGGRVRAVVPAVGRALSLRRRRRRPRRSIRSSRSTSRRSAARRRCRTRRPA